MRLEQSFSEGRKFRRGENSKKPIGGNISPDPFPQALYSLAKSKGYESQLSLAGALGIKKNSSVKEWYSGRLLPNPISLGNILTILEPGPQELNHLLKVYATARLEKRGVKLFEADRPY